MSKSTNVITLAGEPNAGRFVSYVRVSTAKQGRSGLGLEAQRDAVYTYLNGGRWKLVDEFVEVESGKKADRPELAKALAACRVHGATLVVAKMDRLSRNAAFLLNLQESQVKFVAADNPAANFMTVGILAVVAQGEAEMISARTKAALKAAKARGTKLGSPLSMAERVRKQGRMASLKARQASSERWLSDVRPIVQSAADEAGSLVGAASLLNERTVPARRGGDWTATQVARVLRLL